MTIPDVPLASWGTLIASISGGLLVRLGWYVWRRLTGNPVPFLGEVLTRIADGVASIVLLGNTAAGLLMRAKLSEAREKRTGIHLKEANGLLAVALEMLAEKGVSRKDLESRVGSDSSSGLYLGDLIEPTPSKPKLPTSSRTTSGSRVKRRRNRRSGTSETP